VLEQHVDGRIKLFERAITIRIDPIGIVSQLDSIMAESYENARCVVIGQKAFIKQSSVGRNLEMKQLTGFLLDILAVADDLGYQFALEKWFATEEDHTQALIGIREIGQAEFYRSFGSIERHIATRVISRIAVMTAKVASFGQMKRQMH
jgi:hypothetical protein